MLAIDRRRLSSISVAYATVLLPASALPTRAHTFSDAQVRQPMIAESIAAYPGHCPCPYNLASLGSSGEGHQRRWRRGLTTGQSDGAQVLSAHYDEAIFLHEALTILLLRRRPNTALNVR